MSDEQRQELLRRIPSIDDLLSHAEVAPLVGTYARSAMLDAGTLGPHALELPVDWELPDEQPQPQWIGLITSTWLSPRIMRYGPTE